MSSRQQSEHIEGDEPGAAIEERGVFRPAVTIYVIATELAVADTGPSHVIVSWTAGYWGIKRKR